MFLNITKQKILSCKRSKMLKEKFLLLPELIDIEPKQFKLLHFNPQTSKVTIMEARSVDLVVLSLPLSLRCLHSLTFYSVFSF